MSCTVTLNFTNGLNIILDGIDENSVQNFYNYSNILDLINKRGLTAVFMKNLQTSGFDKASAYVDKDMKGLLDTKNFFLPNMTYLEFRKLFPTAPQIDGNVNVLLVNNLKINGHNMPKVFMTRDANGNEIYIVDKQHTLRFINHMIKVLAILNSPITNSFLNFVSQLESTDLAWLRAFSSFSYTASSSLKSRQQYKGTEAIAREILASYIRNPEGFYNYLMSGKNGNFAQNVERIRKIKTEINNLQEYNPPKDYNSPFANAVMLHTSFENEINSKGQRVKLRCISILDFKHIVKLSSPELYEKYFKGDIDSNPLAITSKVNAVMNELFNKVNGEVNLATVGISVAKVFRGKIWFDEVAQTFDKLFGYTILTIEDIPTELAPLNGWNVFEVNKNGKKVYFISRQSFSESIIPGTTYSNEWDARLAAKNKFNNDPIKQGLLLGIYRTDLERGQVFNIKSANSLIRPRLVIRALDVSIDEKYMSKAIANMTVAQAMQFIRDNYGEVDLNLLNSSEKVYLTATKLNELLHKPNSSISELDLFINEDLNHYKYYYVTNVDNGKSQMKTITLLEIPNIDSHAGAPKGYVSMFLQMNFLANKILNRFGVETRVMTALQIKDAYGENASKALAFVTNDTIIINGDVAHKSDLAHEYMHIFMGIVKHMAVYNENLRGQYEMLLTNLVENTALGKQLLRQYQNVNEYLGLSKLDFYEEVAANIMGIYMTDENPQSYSQEFLDFRLFLLENTFNEDLKENILDFTDNIKAATTLHLLSDNQVKDSKSERQITNLIRRSINNNSIIEKC